MGTGTDGAGRRGRSGTEPGPRDRTQDAIMTTRRVRTRGNAGIAPGSRRLRWALCPIVLSGCAAGFRAPVTRAIPAARADHLRAKKGFGGGGFGGGAGTKKKKKGAKKKGGGGFGGGGRKEKPSAAVAAPPPLVSPAADDQDALIKQLLGRSATTCIGRAVAAAPPPPPGAPADPFWELMPSLVGSRFPRLGDGDLARIAGFVRHALDPGLPLEEEIVSDPHRPEREIHAYMPGLGATQPFHDPDRLELCRRLRANYDAIANEYDALVDDMENGGRDRFQSVTSMNYESGWKTLVLFYNGHRIDGFPYHLCPTTTRIMESVPIAGRIAGFNRQRPRTGIPLHTDGNNMWLTCQMGMQVPDGQAAWIRVGPETRRWAKGECLLYDTTYEHETFNEHPDQERVVLHIDFFNTLAMTPAEIEVMQYIYSIREEFMKAEGVAKVGAQVL